MKVPSVAVVTGTRSEALYLDGELVIERPNVTNIDIIRAVIGTVRVYKFSPSPGESFPYDLVDVVKEMKG